MFTTRPELIGTHGMVGSTHWLASAAAMAVLEDGGNAFDAAVAGGFVLQVVEPHLNGPGGEVPAVFATAEEREPKVLCGQGVAPAAATIAHFRDLGLDMVPGSGLLPATVPGSWDGWLLLLRDYGTRSLREVLGYAIGYAERGYPLVDRASETIGVVAELFTQHWPTSAQLWLRGGKPVHTKHRNPVLAQTWQRLLAEAESAGPSREAQIDAARRAWYQGFVAEAVEEFCQRAYRDDSGVEHAGLLTGADMANWQASIEDPVTVAFGDYTIAKVGPWSQGPVLAQQLLMLNELRDQLSYVDGVPTAHTVHLAVECAKLAFADREAFYGDSAEVPIKDLLSTEYARKRLALLGSEASMELRPGSPGGHEPRLPSYVESGRGVRAALEGLPAGAIGEPTVSRDGQSRGDTVHIDVVDAAGNMISATPSGGWLQSSPSIPELGFCLGTRAQMFWLEDGLPASLRPGKRPRSTLSPTMALRDGEPVMAFGTPGGDQQDQWQVCFLLAYTLGWQNLQAAIDAPGWQSAAFPSSFYPRDWRPGELVVESRLGSSIMDELRERGHDIVDAGPWALGRMSAVRRDPALGLLYAASNPRGAQGYAVGR